jgi:hypothetical protein
MNEHEWLIATDPGPMLDHLDGKVSERKLRLFACACVRRYWERLSFHLGREGGKPTDDQILARRAVLVAERYAEGDASDGHLEDARQSTETSWGYASEFAQPAHQAAWAVTLDPAIEAARQAREFARLQAVRDAAYEVPPGWSEAQYNAAESARESRMQCELLREIFANPFRPVTIDPNWLRCNAGAAGAILQTIQEEQRFAELPYLADALMDAGCADEALLRHLREPAGHVRGCWVIDALLGRG